MESTDQLSMGTEQNLASVYNFYFIFHSLVLRVPFFLPLFFSNSILSHWFTVKWYGTQNTDTRIRNV